MNDLKALTWDEATVSLWQAIQAIKFGNPTDDKLIVRNLAAAGICLARREEAKPSE